MDHPRRIFQQHGLRPKKSLGQNFLYDDHILARIVEIAAVSQEDDVLEIGPGVGHLTRHLARAARRVVAVELDDRLLPVLREQLAGMEHVTLVHGDILEQDPARWFGHRANNGNRANNEHGAYKVVANVPYYITGAILQHLLDGPSKPQLMVMTLQKEVAERLVAQPGEMTLLAVSVQFFGEPHIEGEIKAGAFWPRPDVDSAIVRIDLHRSPLLDPQEQAAFFRLVRTGFSQKRKQLQKNLRALGFERRQTVALLRQAGVDPKRRAQTLSVEEWLTVYRTFAHAGA